ncbi:MAG: cyclic nucleotide-binding domain-containing protein [Bacteroidota bacterium]
MNLLSLGQPKTVAKGSYLLRAGEHCNGLFYIKEGLARVFYLKDGKEITDWFAGSGTFLTAMDSFHSEKVSDQYIEALSDLAFVYIERKATKAAYESQPRLKDEYLSIVSQHLISLQVRVKALQF